MRGVNGFERGGQTVDCRRIGGRKIIGCRRLNLSDRIAQRGQLAERAVEGRRIDIQRARRIQRIRGAGELAQAVDDGKAGERRKIGRQQQAGLKRFDDEKMVIAGGASRRSRLFLRSILAAFGKT